MLKKLGLAALGALAASHPDQSVAPSMGLIPYANRATYGRSVMPYVPSAPMPLTTSVVPNFTPTPVMEPKEVLAVNDAVKQDIQSKKLNDLILVCPHNSATTSSLSLFGVPIVSPNQIKSLDELLEALPATHVLALDIDMSKGGLRGQITSRHGGMLLGMLNTSTDSTKTEYVLEKVFTAAKNNPSSVIIVRIENTNVGPNDIWNILTEKQRSQLFTIQDRKIPTVQEVTGSGKNVLFFLQKNRDGLDMKSGTYVGYQMMAQDYFMFRTMWNDVPCLMGSTSDTVEQCMLMDNTDILAGHEAFVTIDGYSTGTGTAFPKLSQVTGDLSNILKDTRPQIAELAKKHNIAVGLGTFLMADGVTTRSLVAQTLLNTMNTTSQDAFLENPVFLDQGELGAFTNQRAIIDSFMSLGAFVAKREPMNRGEVAMLAKLMAWIAVTGAAFYASYTAWPKRLSETFEKLTVQPAAPVSKPYDLLYP